MSVQLTLSICLKAIELFILVLLYPYPWFYGLYHRFVTDALPYMIMIWVQL